LSYTVKSKELLKRMGYYGEVCESFNSFTKRRKDVLSFGDIIALSLNPPASILLCQSTSLSNLSARWHKVSDKEIDGQPNPVRLKLLMWLENSGEFWIVVHENDKPVGKRKLNTRGKIRKVFLDEKGEPIYNDIDTSTIW